MSVFGVLWQFVPVHWVLEMKRVACYVAFEGESPVSFHLGMGEQRAFLLVPLLPCLCDPASEAPLDVPSP